MRHWIYHWMTFRNVLQSIYLDQNLLPETCPFDICPGVDHDIVKQVWLVAIVIAPRHKIKVVLRSFYDIINSSNTLVFLSYGSTFGPELKNWYLGHSNQQLISKAVRNGNSILLLSQIENRILLFNMVWTLYTTLYNSWGRCDYGILVILSLIDKSWQLSCLC